MVMEAFKKVLCNPLIDEIIILDDHSSPEIFCELWNLVNNLDNDKVKLYRNSKNLQPLLNKYELVKKCKNDWVIMLDSDNIIDDNYIKSVSKLDTENDVVYCPEVLYAAEDKTHVHWNYKEFNQVFIDKDNVKKYMNNGLFTTWMNTGNYFFNRKTYLNVIEDNEKDERLSVSDSFYFSYLWLLSGGRMKVVPDLYYIHRIHEGSYYLNHKKILPPLHNIIEQKIKAL